MNDLNLFQMALGLTPPWQVSRSEFDPAQRRLDLHLDFSPGSTFPCPKCDLACKVHDTETRTWRHLDFFQHAAYLHARHPRTSCSDCGVHRAAVPWARPGSGFSLLFEALLMAMVPEMPVLAVARIVGETDTRIWRVVQHYVDEARAQEDFSAVTKVGLDETSRAKRHKYVTLFVDLDRSKVLFATEGKDAETLQAFRKDLEAHNGSGDSVEELSMDMSPAFVSGAAEHFSKASVTFDRFHVMGLMNLLP